MDEAVSHRLLATRHNDRRLQRKDRRQETLDHRTRQPVHHADHQLAASALRAVPHGLQERVASREDAVCKTKRLPPRIRQHHAAPLTPEELAAQCLLKQVNLRRNRGRREAKLQTRPRDAAYFGDFPEILEVVVIQPVHDASPRLLALTEVRDRSPAIRGVAVV